MERCWWRLGWCTRSLRSGFGSCCNLGFGRCARLTARYLRYCRLWYGNWYRCWRCFWLRYFLRFCWFRLGHLLHCWRTFWDNRFWRCRRRRCRHDGWSRYLWHIAGNSSLTRRRPLPLLLFLRIPSTVRRDARCPWYEGSRG